ncbi:Rne/Rng family ribonuclease [Salipiger bermudensis]|uniref:Ribonuclease E n=1 Tax=Salipiger bermudensis (strain DSM 26914 / JCM 13377 / KCTC 12554 / HTCC2601) TaxID=314265 RepID=Q0FTF7_SALBH|nr:ribonuclease E/G [Salipiger bermudensis]EAU47495.1 ribonuclease, Rne/Rng family protein [Salipiger bermudensis HTCC2601]
MAKKMLIDATHAEETRVVVVDGNKVEEFDFESENKRQLAGNIYLAKVTRVEPSLQAAFVDYGGNRHGFLAFSEIHPDYYQIPVADRQALMEEEAALAAEAEEEEDQPKSKRSRSRRSRSRTSSKAEKARSEDKTASADPSEIKGMETIDLGEDEIPDEDAPSSLAETVSADATDTVAAADAPVSDEPAQAGEEAVAKPAEQDTSAPAAEETVSQDTSDDDADDSDDDDTDDGDDHAGTEDSIESVADDDTEEEIRPKRKPRPRKYKIQEVIKVRQIMLVQVVKEERGNKGAALTTYLSLAGRYCVLMPNTARGGGISRKITNAADRSKLKQIATEIDVPKGAGLIIRTAGAKRTKTEIKRDYEYLQRLWEQIRALTLQSVAPAKIYEEGDLIKRSIRDLYNREIDEVHVEGDRGYRIAKDFMKMIMPSHAKNVKHYVDPMPLFARYQVESYLSSMFNPTVQLKSGGYIVIGVTEALVAIDVNSGRATKEGSIEETALKTNLEAAEEVARQLRLRDLAGLIVIDFIDMEERKNNAAVEKKIKDKLKTDRARIQVGRISGFGLLEMSRQRLRPGMIEATTQPCHACHGTGLVRSDDNMALNILRQVEEEGTRRRSREVLLKVPVGIANYLMNQKREHVAMIEARYGMAVRIEGDLHLVSPDFTMEKFKTATRNVAEVLAPVVSVDTSLMDQIDEDALAEEDEDESTEDSGSTGSETENGAENNSDSGENGDNGDDEGKPKKRRRRRRRSRSKKSNGEGENGSENGADNDSGKGDSDNGESGTDTPSDAATETTGEATTEEVAAAETDDAPAKPKRTRTRSRSRKPKADVVTETTDAIETEAAPAEAETSGAAVVEASEPAPAAEDVAAPAPEAEGAAVSEAQPEAEVAEVPETVEAEAPAPVEAERQPAPEAEPAAEAPTQAPEPAEEAASVVEEASEEVAPAAPEAEPAPEPAPEPETVSETAEPEAANAEADDKPKRRGWWSIGR